MARFFSYAAGAMWVCCAVALAAPGDLDTTFGGTGKIRVGVGGSKDAGNAIARQADGKLIVAGAGDNLSNIVFTLARYNTNGSLGTSSGVGGRVQTSIGLEAEINAITIVGRQNSGRGLYIHRSGQL